MGRGADRARSVVLIEDESAIAASVAARLRAEGYVVHVAADGPGGVELCGRVQPDLVVLDLMLPGYDGIEVCRRIQKERPVPVLILTARDSETDLLVGLGIGADDYMTKPFSMRELVARVGALLRRVERSSERGRASLRVGPVEIDSAGRRVTVSGHPVHLTPLEFDLLARLCSTPGIVLSREQLLADVWGYGDGSGARTIDSHIASLRRKLGPGIVRTVHGVGYSVEGTAK
jgi:DNA-binding response OmpR family regulator